MFYCLENSNAVKLIEEFSLDEKVYIVTKYMKGGDLLEYLDKKGIDRLPECQAHHIVKQLAYGVNGIHEQGIVHRDLKHKNIFLSDFSNTPKVMIGDFGLSCKLEEGEAIIKVAGTIGFMAPEVIQED